MLVVMMPGGRPRRSYKCEVGEKVRDIVENDILLSQSIKRAGVLCGILMLFLMPSVVFHDKRKHDPAKS